MQATQESDWKQDEREAAEQDARLEAETAEALEAEAQIQAALMLHPDFRESYDAFVEKRDPHFL